MSAHTVVANSIIFLNFIRQHTHTHTHIHADEKDNVRAIVTQYGVIKNIKQI